MSSFGKRILITGGCGFIGSNVARRLHSESRDIIILDNLSSGRKKNVRGFYDELVIGDLCDAGLVRSVCRNVDVIVHLAAHTYVIKSIENPARDFHTNVVGTFNLLRAAVANGVKSFVFASSGAVLGNVGPPIDEGKVPQPLSPYGASKLCCEGYLSSFANSFGLKTVALRFSNVYGPFSDHKTSVIASFIQLLKKRKRWIIYGDGRQTRDFLYVDDLVDAIVATEKVKTGGEVFQIASGVETSINALARTLQRVSKRRVRIVYKPKRTGEVYKSSVKIDKARRILGFRPRVMLHDGLAKTMEWFESRRLV